MKPNFFVSILALAGTAFTTLAQEVDPFAPKPAAPAKAEGTTIEEKLVKIQIPSIEFVETALEDCVMFLQQRSQELDPTRDPRQKGVNIVLRPLERKANPRDDIRITLKTGAIPLQKALGDIGKEANKQVWLEHNAVVIGDHDQRRGPAKIAKDAATQAMVEKLKALKIPSAEFVDTPLKDVIAWIHVRLADLEDKSVAPLASAIKIETTGKVTVHDPFFDRETERRIVLGLRNTSAFDLISHIAGQAELDLKWEANKITLIGEK